MDSPAVSLALVQMECGATWERNLERAGDLIRLAAARGAQVVCLPELFAHPYPAQDEDPARFDLAEPVPGPTTESLAAVARAAGVVVVGSVFERRAEGVFHNTAVVLDADGSLLGRYRKMHIPDDPLYFEKYYFAPGDLGFPTFATRFGRLAVLVCWDQWFPEAARLAALGGAEILLYPTAIGWDREDRDTEEGVRQREAWETVQRGHAIANGVFVAAVNRVGREGELDFWGGSFICDPLGTVLARAGTTEELVIAQCPRSRLQEVRRAWPFLRDRRIDAYQGLLRRFLD